MEIAGNKVVLRTAKEQDEELLISLVQDPGIAKVTGGYPSPASYGHQMDWFCIRADSDGNQRYIIADKGNPRVGLGIILLSQTGLKKGMAEVYIKLKKSARGKGYGESAVNALVSFAFCELRLEQVCANILESNMPSRRLFEKCGFRLKGIHTGREGQEGGCRNVYSYEIGCGNPCRKENPGGG